MFVIIPLAATIVPWWNNGDTALLKNHSDYLLGIIRFIRDGELRIKALDQGRGHNAVMRVAPGEYKPERVTQRVHRRVYFRCQSTAASANGLGCAAPLAPLACWWARTYEPSTMMDSKSASRLSSSMMVVQTPVLAHALKRLYTVCHGPNSSGRSRQGAPVRNIQTTPLRMQRVSALGLPRGSLRHGRTWGSSLCQRLSGISCLLMMSSLP